MNWYPALVERYDWVLYYLSTDMYHVDALVEKDGERIHVHICGTELVECKRLHSDASDEYVQIVSSLGPSAVSYAEHIEEVMGEFPVAFRMYPCERAVPAFASGLQPWSVADFVLGYAFNGTSLIPCMHPVLVWGQSGVYRSWYIGNVFTEMLLPRNPR